MQVKEAYLLKIDDATVRRGNVKPLNKVSLEIPEGQHTAIVGPNGSGKSTLIKLIARLLHPLAHDDGRPIVSVFGQSDWNVFELRGLLGIVSPELHSSFTSAGGITGLDAVISGFFASQGTFYHQIITEEMVHRASEALQEFGAEGLAAKPMEIMSAGEARRVLIARALVHRPRALLLDEPTTGLDISSRRKFLEILRKIATQGRTLLLVTHHVDEIIPEIKRVILMKNGTVFADGPKESILTSDHLSNTFEENIVINHSEHGYYSADLR